MSDEVDELKKYLAHLQFQRDTYNAQARLEGRPIISGEWKNWCGKYTNPDDEALEAKWRDEDARRTRSGRLSRLVRRLWGVLTGGMRR